MNANKSGSSISRRILLLALLPPTAVAIILAAYFSATRYADFQLSLQQQAHSWAADLASASTQAVLARDIASLTQLSTMALREPMIESVVFYDRAGHILYAGGGNPPLVDAVPLAGEGELTGGFRVPIYLPATVSDEPGGDTAEEPADEVAGWVQLAVNNHQLHARQRELLLTGLLITTLGMLVVGLIALRMARGLIQPMQELVRTLRLLEAGESKTRAPVRGNDEVSQLAQAVNALAERVEESEESLHYRVDRATVRLTRTLSVLESRNSELEKTRVELETALLARDAFLARVSHELRTPLTSMLGYSDLLGGSQLNEVQRGYNSNVRFAAQLLLGTINDLLDVASLGANAMRLELHDFDLPRCLEQVCLVHVPAAREKGLELVISVERDVPARVYADELRICQIINNLMGNAVKFTDSGRVVLSVSCGARVDDQVELNISVEDTGIGIEAGQIAHIFDAFARAEGIGAERYGGTGLGLAIVRSLTQLMGGEVVASSVEGRGTVVNCRLLVAAGFDTLSSQLAPFPECAVLISEPDPVARRILRAMTLAATRDVTVFHSAQRMVDHLRDGQSADLLLLGVATAACEVPSLNVLLAEIAQCYSGPLVLASAQLPAGCEVPAKLNLIHLQKPVGYRRLNSVFRELFAKTNDRDCSVFPSGTAAENDSPLAGKMVLLAEDNVLNREMISQILSDLGAGVHAVADGNELVACFTADKFDLLLVDLNMPGANGRDAILKLRNSYGKDCLPPIILLTAAVLDEVARADYDGLVDAVLNKPLEMGVFVATLGRLLAPGKPALPARFLDIQPADLSRELQRLVMALGESLQQGNVALLQSLLHQLCGLPVLAGRFMELANFARELDADSSQLADPRLVARLRSLLDQLAATD